MNDSEDRFRNNPPGTLEHLGKASVGIAGAGGIGSNIAWILVRAGIGRIVVADFDSVELHNLNRQFYFTDQIGYPKVEALGHNLRLINPEADIQIHNRMIDADNACSIFSDCQILVEAVDREETKVMILESWLDGLPEKHIYSCSGLAGTGGTDALGVDRRRGLTIVGDQISKLELGTLSSRVCIVAAMMANELIADICDS